MSKQHIVLEDPKNEYWPGALITVERALALQSRGVVTQPVIPELFHHGALGGFFRRDWGSGWSIPATPGPCAPMAMFTVTAVEGIRWTAKLIATQVMLEEIKQGKRPVGMLRLVADGNQAGSSGGCLSNNEDSVVDLSKLGEPDADGTWTVHGSARVNVPTDLLIGYTLYGYAREMRVVWAAISQTE